ncbi:2-aminoethylphosphonate--pyruvate transaminase [Rhodovibrionaceae bacterium A322]
MSTLSLSPDSSAPAQSPTGDPWLLTPGPLTTSPSVKEAMLHDYGSRDTHFIAINKRVRQQLLTIIDGEEDFVAVPLQGSGTFSVEAMITTFLPSDGKLLILINGAYGSRIAKICKVAGLAHSTLEWAENQPVDPSRVDEALEKDADITHVAVIHCETTSGILNPIKEVSDVVAKRGRRLLIDSMSAFGALPVSAKEVQFDAIAASSNKCLEGVPGMGFVLSRRSALEDCQGNCHSLTLDLHDQWVSMEKNDQWRFTPPTHCIVAFDQAITEFVEEGGVAGRGGRYAANCEVLVTGMRDMGFETLLPDELQAPIIVTFHQPSDPKFVFQDFYDRLRERGYVIYPGKLTVADSFRIGCIGRLGETEIRGALATIKETLQEMGVTQTGPAA